MQLIRDEPQWTFTGFPGFAPRHLRVWRENTGRVVAVVTEHSDRNDDTIGTALIEAYELVLAQLHADHPDDVIEFLVCEPRAEVHFDQFNRIVLREGGQTEYSLNTNDTIRRLGADGLYRPFDREQYRFSGFG